MADARDCFGQRLRKLECTVTITFEQMKCHPLCRLSADSRHAAQGVDEAKQ
jgi:hypothetical protein